MSRLLKRKNQLLFVSGCILVIILAALIIHITRTMNYINTSFATEISLKFYYGGKQIDKIVTDENDIRVIKESLKGESYTDNPSCGFSLDISIKLSNGEEDIIFHPACDGCSKARIGATNRYIDVTDRKTLEAVLKKYGMLFPCV